MENTVILKKNTAEVVTLEECKDLVPDNSEAYIGFFLPIFSAMSLASI